MTDWAKIHDAEVLAAAGFEEKKAVDDVPVAEFRLQAKFMALTYKTHINKGDLRDFHEKLFPDTPIVVWEAAHEKGLNDPDTPYDHTHVAIEWKKAVNKRNAQRLFDYAGIHPFMGLKKGMIKNKQMFNDWLGYMSKEDPECAHLKNFGKKKFEMILKCATVQDAMMQAENYGDALGIKMMWDMRGAGVIEELEGWKPWGWQLDVQNLWKTYADPRKIYWAWEPEGEKGKTTYCKWLMYTNPNFFLTLQGVGYIRDTVQNVKNAIDGGWNGFAVIINLPRKFEALEFIWETIEAIKDGLYSSVKYNGSSFLTRIPHILVFANYEPNIIGKDGKLLISADRLVHWRMQCGGVDPNVKRQRTGPLPVWAD